MDIEQISAMIEQFWEYTPPTGLLIQRSIEQKILEIVIEGFLFDKVYHVYGEVATDSWII